MDEKKEFFIALKEGFAPKLREIGFKGSGQNFRRVRNKVINTINIQGNRYGGSCAVNLGLHLAFLPLSWVDQLPDLKKIKVTDCEFTMRLAPGNKEDYWWDFATLFKSPTKKAQHLINTYFRYGEPKFQKFDSVEKIASMLSLDDIKNQDYLELFAGITVQRGALAIARIHKHLGNLSQSKDFAEAGLNTIDCAETLRVSFQELINPI